MFVFKILILILFLSLEITSSFAANSTISSLPSGTLSDADEFVINDGGVTKKVTGSAVRSYVGGKLFFKLASDYTNATTTGTEITGLGPMTLTAGGYEFDMYLLVQSSVVTTGWKLGINYTGSITTLAVNMLYPSTGTTDATGVGEDIVANNTGSIYESAAATAASTTAPNLGPTAGVATINANVLVHVKGLIVVSNGGDLELWAASETANTITVKANSVAFITPLQ